MRACIVAGFMFLVAAPLHAKFIFVCDENNDLYRACPAELSHRAASVDDALNNATAGAALLVLADGYPTQRTPLPHDCFARVAAKKLRVYVEFPAHLKGETKTTQWQRGVITSGFFTPALPKLRIVAPHDCHYIPTTADNVHLVISRVAGYDTAVYGVAKDAAPLLYELADGRTLIATTKLSNFVTARYAPTADWKIIWQSILHKLDPGQNVELNIELTVRPNLSATQPAPPNFELDTFNRAARFYVNSRLLISKDRQAEIRRLLAAGTEISEAPQSTEHADGSFGMLEGYAAQIRHDGTQPQRTPIRADCNAEAAMVLSLATDDARSKQIATNLLTYIFGPEMQSLGRLDSKHPAFGLIAWGAISPAWQVANYGDDNSRVILAAIAASAAIETDRFDEHILRALYANLRTTGSIGFRGDRIDIPELEQHGWKHFHDAKIVNFSPHFESGLWACYLWAYRATGDRAFLDKTLTGIELTMQAYEKNQWRWMDNTERSRMLLCLAWLVRIDDTPTHRQWVTMIARDLLANQQPCGAIPERFGHNAGGHFQVPQSNDAYGTTETPLIQQNGDPVSDQLYTTGFALFALHEATACGFANLKPAEEKLADYLCRIQVRSEKHPELDGGWFRAFDFKRWDYWASSADAGWGAWSLEAGWAPAWTAASLALRHRHTTFWEFTATSKLRDQLPKVQHDLSQNDGSPSNRPN
jgi:hypothetical protein